MGVTHGLGADAPHGDVEFVYEKKTFGAFVLELKQQYHRGPDGKRYETEDDKRANEGARKAAARKGRCLPGPAEIKRIRLKLGLSQRRASECLGGGLRSFQKYEAGSTLPCEAMAKLLALLDSHPEMLEEAETCNWRYGGH